MRALLATGLKALAQFLPGLRLVGGQLLPREGPQPRGGLGHQLHRTTQHQGGRGTFPPGRPPFVIAMRAKELFEIIIGAREIRHARAVEKPRPITAADLEKVIDSGGERARGGAVPCHGSEEPLQAPLHHCLIPLVFVVQDVSRTMHPVIGHPHVRPQGGCVIQTPLEDGLQAPQFLGQAPLFSTGSRPSAMALRRSCSVRGYPEI